MLRLTILIISIDSGKYKALVHIFSVVHPPLTTEKSIVRMIMLDVSTTIFCLLLKVFLCLKYFISSVSL